MAWPDPSRPGGSSAIKTFRKAGIRLKGDEWILGDSEFVEQVLDTANESLENRYIKGYDFNRVVEHVAELLGMETEDILRSGKQQQTVKA